MHKHVGVRAHFGKRKTWSRRRGSAPKGLEGAWQGDKKDTNNGLMVLGTPLGTNAFAKNFAAERLEKKRKLLEELPKLNDLHCKNNLARNVATLPERLRGLGARSAVRNSAATYSASCVGSLPVFKTKMPLFGACSLRCLLYTSPSPRDATLSRMPSSA